MALTETNVQLYMEGLCKVATQGNVEVGFAWLANRMELFCKKCKQTLTAAKPEDTTVDYAVQEFLKLHLHKVHPDYCQCEQCIAIVKQKQKDTGAFVTSKPVTLDFKPVPTQSFTGEETYKAGMDMALKSPDATVVMTNIHAPDPDGYGLTNLPKVKEPHPDKDAAKLFQALNTFKGEYAAKVNDVALANKIKLLQLSSQEQATIQAMKQKLLSAQQEFQAQAGQITASDGTYYSKDEVEKLKYELSNFSYKHPLPIVQHKPYIAPQPPVQAPKKEKPLKQAVGRKIR